MSGDELRDLACDIRRLIELVEAIIDADERIRHRVAECERRLEHLVGENAVKRSRTPDGR